MNITVKPPCMPNKSIAFSASKHPSRFSNLIPTGLQRSSKEDSYKSSAPASPNVKSTSPKASPNDGQATPPDSPELLSPVPKPLPLGNEGVDSPRSSVELNQLKCRTSPKPESISFFPQRVKPAQAALDKGDRAVVYLMKPLVQGLTHGNMSDSEKAIIKNLSDRIHKLLVNNGHGITSDEDNKADKLTEAENRECGKILNDLIELIKVAHPEIELKG